MKNILGTGNTDLTVLSNQIRQAVVLTEQVKSLCTRQPVTVIHFGNFLGIKSYPVIMGFRYKLYLVCLCSLTLTSFCTATSEDIIIKNAERTIDVASQLVKITHRLTLSNTGKSSVNNFNFPIEPKAQQKLSYFKAQVKTYMTTTE